MPKSQTPNEKPTRAHRGNKKQSPEHNDPATLRDALNRELDAQTLYFSAQMQARVLAAIAEDAAKGANAANGVNAANAANGAEQAGPPQRAATRLGQSLRAWLNREVRIPIVVVAAPLMLLFAVGGVLAFSASGASSGSSGTPTGTSSPNSSLASLTHDQLSSTVTLETGVFSLTDLTKQGR